MSADTVSEDSTALTTSHEIYRLLHDIYVLLDAEDRNLLREFNLSATQYTLLTLLGSSEGQRLTTLSDRLLVARSTITRLITQMEANGLVHRVDDPEDRRAQRVALTTTGDATLRRAYAAHEQSLEQRLCDMRDGEQQELAHLLKKMRSCLRSNLGIPDSTI